jgi:hypothetical protein
MITQTIVGVVGRGLRRALPGIMAGLSLAPFALSTSPLPPPYFRYDVNGRVQTVTGAPAQGIVVVLYARTDPDSAWRLAGSTGLTDDLPIGVTSVDGSFALSVRTNQRAESLAVGMTALGRAMGLSHSFHPDSALAWPVRRTATSTDGRGCSGCGTGPSAYEYTEYYRTMISRDLVLPE